MAINCEANASKSPNNVNNSKIDTNKPLHNPNNSQNRRNRGLGEWQSQLV